MQLNGEKGGVINTAEAERDVGGSASRNNAIRASRQRNISKT